MSMMWIAKVFMSRPSDKTIATWRIIFGLLLSLTLYYNLIYLWKWIDNLFLDFSIFWYVISYWWVMNNSELLIVKYWFSAMWLVPIIMWLTNMCLFKKKYMRITQITFAFVLFYIAAIINESATLDIDTLIWFMWILPLFAWITGKCISAKCLKFWEKITKIRV
jgi:hypothetical protein